LIVSDSLRGSEHEQTTSMVRLTLIRLLLLAMDLQCSTLRLMLICKIPAARYQILRSCDSDSADSTREDCCLLVSNYSHEKSRLTLLDKKHITIHVPLRVGSVRHINSQKRSKSAMTGAIDILSLLSTTRHTSPSGFFSYSMSLPPISFISSHVTSYQS